MDTQDFINKMRARQFRSCFQHTETVGTLVKQTGSVWDDHGMNFGDTYVVEGAMASLEVGRYTAR